MEIIYKQNIFFTLIFNLLKRSSSNAYFKINNFTKFDRDLGKNFFAALLFHQDPFYPLIINRIYSTQQSGHLKNSPISISRTCRSRTCRLIQRSHNFFLSFQNYIILISFVRKLSLYYL